MNSYFEKCELEIKLAQKQQTNNKLNQTIKKLETKISNLEEQVSQNNQINNDYIILEDKDYTNDSKYNDSLHNILNDPKDPNYKNKVDVYQQFKNSLFTKQFTLTNVKSILEIDIQKINNNCIMVYDTETTGLLTNFYKPHIVSIGLIIYDPQTKEISIYYDLIKPYYVCHITDWMGAEKIHHITRTDVETKGVDFEKVVEKIINVIKNVSHIIGYNHTEYDNKMFNSGHYNIELKATIKELLRYKPNIDMLKIVQQLDKVVIPGQNRNNYIGIKGSNRLTNVYKRMFEISLNGAHHALVDCLATLDIYCFVKDVVGYNL